MLSDAEPKLRQSLYWVLSQLGGPESLDVLENAANTTDDKEFTGWQGHQPHASYRSVRLEKVCRNNKLFHPCYTEVVRAISYSPDPAANELLLSIVKETLKSPRAKIAAREGVRRMVIGPDDVGTLSNKQRLDYAQPLLDMVLDPSTITYLGCVRSGRSAFILQGAMRRGDPATAAKAIIDATSDLSGAPAADRALATSALIDTIEFIEVTYLRGGVAAALKKSKEAQGAYVLWKSLSAQAGKNLLKLDKPEETPIPEFDDLDLDL